MKILLITGSINQGGAEFQLLALTELLQRKGFDVQVLALTNHTYYLPYIYENKLLYSFVTNDGSSLSRLIRSVKAVGKIKPDLVISYIRVTSQVAMLAKISNLFRFKLIISERTSLILPRYDLIYFNLALLANKITVNSTFKFEYIKRKFPLLKAKTVFIPNIINIKKYATATKRTYEGDKLLLGCVGRVSPEKNLINLVKAILLLLDKNYKLNLKIIGQTNNPAYLNKLQSLIDSSAHSDKFQIVGPSKDIFKDYQSMDLLCHVSLYEGFSNVISEAMCSGLPIIGSSIEEIKFFINDEENGFLVNPDSHVEIADGIEKFIQLTQQQKADFALNSKKRAIQLFDENVVYEQYVELFNSLKLK
jgi:glycosyltransferase involved in cell wall biosynthesis